MGRNGGMKPKSGSFDSSGSPAPSHIRESIHFLGMLRRQWCLLATAEFWIPSLKGSADVDFNIPCCQALAYVMVRILRPPHLGRQKLDFWAIPGRQQLFEV